MTLNYPYWNNDEVISSDKLNSMVQAIINGDPLAVKVSNATKNDVNQIISYLSSLHDSAKTNLNSATSTNDFDTAYTNMTALVSNKLGSYANDDTVDLYSTGIRASIITFLQAYDTMMSNDRLNNKNTDNTLNSRIDNEAQIRSDANTSINNSLNAIKANGGGRNLLLGTGTVSGDVARGDYFRNSIIAKGVFNGYDAFKTNSAWDGRYINLKSVLGRTNAKVGDWFTISVYVKADKQIDTGRLMVCRALGGVDADTNDGFLDAIQMSNKPITTQWQQYAWSFQINDISLQRQNTRVEYSNDTGDNWIYWAGWMLEKGSVAHDWSPAPEDIEAEITALDAKTMQNRGTVNAPDFNSLTQAGYYTITNPMGGKNYPNDNWGTLEVSGQVVDGNGRLNQKYVSDWVGTIYTRQYNNGTKVWTPWVQMANTNDVDTKIDNLQIGGINLFKDTDKMTNTNYWGLRGGQSVQASYAGKHANVMGISLSDYTVQLNTPTSFIDYVPQISFEHGTDYTVSFWTTFVNKPLLYLNSDDGYNHQHYTSQQTISLQASGREYSIWKQVTATFKPTVANAYLTFGVSTDSANTVSSYWASSFKLEKGNKATDFSLAPEDTDIYTSGRTITFPHNSSITVKDDRIIPHIYLPTYITDYLPSTELNNLVTMGEYDNLFVPSATMATLTNRPTNPDTNAPLTGDCFYTNHYAYSGTTVRAFQKIYSCDYNYVFIRSYNGSSYSWTNWSCLTPYA